MTQRMKFSRPSKAVLLAAAIATTTLLGACAPLVVGGAMLGGAMSYTDRRTAGAQIEDEAIELKAVNRVAALTGGHVNVTSFNRTVLLTGEVPSEDERQAVDKAVGQIEGARATVNELVVGFNSSLTARGQDAILTSKVKASYIDSRDLQSNAVKVVAERGAVYLMGRVTEREAKRASDIARTVAGVTKVVRLFEVISEDELAQLQPKR
jgi:osmotically-inducible protein OsmY